MGIELITGMGGTNHVDSEDVGALNAELIGNGNYLLSGCEVTMTDANTCHVAAGELLLQGRHVRIKGAGEDVSIGNGQAGYNQRYLICLVYSKATSGIETVGLQAFAGAKTTGTATDPAVAAGSILGGDTNVVVPLARLELTGLSVGTPAVMLDSVKGLVALGAETKKLGDSVSQFKVETKDFWTVMTLPTGLRVAWTTEYTGVVGANDGFKKKIDLPFSVDNPKKLCVVSSLTGTDEEMPDYFNSLTVKVNVTSTHVVALIWNESQVRLESLFSIFVMERTVY